MLFLSFIVFPKIPMKERELELNSANTAATEIFNKHMHILLVDDHWSMRRVIIGALSQVGLTNFVDAESGKDAMEILNSDRIDLIISDWNMPNMTGLELLSDVRSDEKLKHIPFIMLTGESSQEKVIEAYKAGITSYIVKPFPPDLLIEKIKAIFNC